MKTFSKTATTLNIIQGAFSDSKFIKYKENCMICETHNSIFELPHDKTNKMTVRSVKTIRPV